MTELTQKGIQALLDRNDIAVEKAVIALYRRQTEEEKKDKTTKEHNGVGFSGVDAKLLTSYAQQLLGEGEYKDRKREHLTDAQMVYARKKVKRYWKQLIQIAAERSNKQ